MNRLIAIILFLLLGNGLYSQSIFDRLESNMADKVSISAGMQFTWFKKSNLYFEQSNYGRQLDIFSAKGHGRTRPNEIIHGKIATTQYRVDIQYKLSTKYIIQGEFVHLDYLVDLAEQYYQRGVWDGIRINGESDLLDKFTLLEHSNGINIWKLGLIRKFSPKSIKKFSLSTGFQLGFVMAATQANIISPYGDIEKFDPGNKPVGHSFSSHIELAYHISSRFELFINMTNYNMQLNKAHINDYSFVTQSLAGANFGLNIRYHL